MQWFTEGPDAGLRKEPRQQRAASILSALLQTNPIDLLLFLCASEANGRRAAAEGYVSGLLMLYEDWHRNDALENSHVPIRRALLHCLHQATGTRAGSAALLEAGGLGLLLHTVQVRPDCALLLLQIDSPGKETN